MRLPQVAVAVMRRIVVPAGSTPAQTAHDFAKALHAAWGVGDAACENGVVLVLAIEDRQVYVSTGTGVFLRFLCLCAAAGEGGVHCHRCVCLATSAVPCNGWVLCCAGHLGGTGVHQHRHRCACSAAYLQWVSFGRRLLRGRLLRGFWPLAGGPCAPATSTPAGPCHHNLQAPRRR